MSSHRRTKQKGSKKPLVIIIIILIIAAIGLGLYFFVFAGKDSSNKTSSKSDSDALINPLTGLEVESLMNRPFILSTGNDNANSRPQSGLSKADIVYEVPIEGGGSRYEQMFYSQLPGRIGSARSVRPYIVNIAREYQAVLVHDGQSPQAKEYLSTGVVDHLSAIDDWDIFFIAEDKPSPHDCYTKGKTILKKMKKRDFDKKKEVRTFQWLKDGDEVSGKDATELQVNYADRTNNTYKYNSKTKLYERYVNDEPCVDSENDKQVTCANVLIQEITYNLYDEERLNLDMTEGNKAKLFTQGKVIEGTWERKDLDSPTIFKDKDGNEFKMTPGQTWVQLVDKTVVVKYK